MPTDRASGLRADEAQALRSRYGANAVEEQRPWPWLMLARKFWAPIPWMLEGAIALELLLGRTVEAWIIGALLVFNAILAFFQESRAQTALDLLREKLEILSRVLRDGQWQRLPARDLVPGDVVHLRMGDIVPADTLLDGPEILLDQSLLTGEAQPVEASAGAMAYAGTLVKRGEATGEIVATGAQTHFGKTAELVRTARSVGHLQRLVFRIVEGLLYFDAVLVAGVLAYSLWAGLSLWQVLPFALIVLVASIPVALPATFTLASALGALELARHDILVPRLAAIEEAAAIDVLCCDKTGTITRNRLEVQASHPYPPHGEQDVLRLAALASDAATQDPIDLAILERAGIPSSDRLTFVPFDPATKRSEATVRESGRILAVAKGAHPAIATLCPPIASLDADAAALAAGGNRVLAVAAGEPGHLRLAGLLALADPPRPDSAEQLQRLAASGVRVMMLTGDSAPTARAVARMVGIGGELCDPARLRADPVVAATECDVFAGILPEDKFHLVRSLQERGHTVGMTGDGGHDAPALKQAEVGIAVQSATDVAKAAASIVLTAAGLAGIATLIATSRRIYQRMLTYTLNKILKTFEIAMFLTLALLLTGEIVTTPLLIVLLLFTNDFVTMSLATDRVRPSSRPDRWKVRPLLRIGLAMAALVMALEFGIFLWARGRFGLPELRTLVFLLLVFTGQGTVYLLRERGHFWHSLPSGWMLLATGIDLAAVCGLAIGGILMAPLPPAVVAGTLGAVVAAMFLLDFAKIAIFRHLGGSTGSAEPLAQRLA